MNHESSSALPAAIRVRGARVHNLKNIDVDAVSYTHLTLPTKA